jgi:hypothetical protein
MRCLSRNTGAVGARCCGPAMVMPPDPPDGRESMAQEAGYKQLLASVDLLVAKMVPGQRMRIKSGRIEHKFRGSRGTRMRRNPGQ